MNPLPPIIGFLVWNPSRSFPTKTHDTIVKLSNAHQAAVDAAMAEVRRRHDLAQQAPDTEVARQALFSLAMAVSKATRVIQTAEYETRTAAEDALIRGRLQRLEQVA